MTIRIEFKFRLNFVFWEDSQIRVIYLLYRLLFFLLLGGSLKCDSLRIDNLPECSAALRECRKPPY
jgi:hypothetical protein